MISIDTIREIDDSTKEGKMLMAALAVLTSITHEQIDDHEYGGMVHPDEAVCRIAELANYIYFTDEFKRQKAISEGINKRDNTINNIIND